MTMLFRGFSKLNQVRPYYYPSFILSFPQKIYIPAIIISQARSLSILTEVDTEITNQLVISNTAESRKWPVFRVLNPDGKIVEGSQTPVINKLSLIQQYTIMCRVQALDDVFYNAQRQGRISFYMQSTGEEATHVG
jgi:2-oxoisovalerate dehydrogenase E1 component alpha subunit